MTRDNFLRLITDVADTTGQTETVLYDYLWSILRHPIIPASINRYLTGSNREINSTEFNYDYVGRLHRLLEQRGHSPE